MRGRSSNHAGVHDAGGYFRRRRGGDDRRVTSVMRPDDYLIGTYRTHGHAIAGGTDPKNVMAGPFEFELSAVMRVIVPGSHARRFRKDFPDYYGELVFSDR